MRQPSWEAVAKALAARMLHHARCPDHDRSEAAPDDCPFCCDRAAHDMYVAKLLDQQKRRTRRVKQEA